MEILHGNAFHIGITLAANDRQILRNECILLETTLRFLANYADLFLYFWSTLQTNMFETLSKLICKYKFQQWKWMTSLPHMSKTTTKAEVFRNAHVIRYRPIFQLAKKWLFDVLSLTSLARHSTQHNMLHIILKTQTCMFFLSFIW